jgi:hypothetical protein
MEAALMSRVQFTDSLSHELAAFFAAPLGVTVDASGLTIDTTVPLAALVGRVARGEAAVLPLRGGNFDRWLVMGASRRELEAVLAGVSRFVVPTYAEHEGGVPLQRDFDPAGDTVNRVAYMLYPAGYYVLRSPTGYFAQILERLALWARLETERPTVQAPQRLSYRDLYDAFSAALSANTWDVAAAHLDEMRKRGLTSAENLAFLEVQLLAQQRRWADLWRREDFIDIARLRAPRAVRDALLAAFHQSELLPLEQEGSWTQALEVFRRKRSRLGRLLEGAADISYGPALRIYAYREAAAGDRRALEQLAVAVPDDETGRALDALLNLLPVSPVTPPPTVAPPALKPQQSLRLALADEDYDAAWSAAQQLDTAGERVRGMLDVAYLSDVSAHAEEALLQLWDLHQPEQEALLQSRRLSQIAHALTQRVTPLPPVAPAEPPLTGWIEWLGAAAADSDDRRLARALDVVATADQGYWTAARVVELAGYLTEIAAGPAITRSHIRSAVCKLRDDFLQDAEFPRETRAYDEVYEALYLATLEQRDVNEATSLALLRLAEARLRRSPAARDTVAQHLIGWFSDPFPALEGTAQEALDLLAAYGVQGPRLALWYRQWADALLSTPRLDRLSLRGWLILGEWVQPGADVLDRLRERLEAIGEPESDPLVALPDRFEIAIFTLRPPSAARVGDELRRRKLGLIVHICDDTVLTDRAKNLAQSAGISVVVTTCITHALTYGIGPYLRDPVYPQSSGSASIMRAIEARLRAR